MRWRLIWRDYDFMKRLHWRLKIVTVLYELRPLWRLLSWLQNICVEYSYRLCVDLKLWFVWWYPPFEAAIWVLRPLLTCWIFSLIAASCDTFLLLDIGAFRVVEDWCSHTPAWSCLLYGAWRLLSVWWLWSLRPRLQRGIAVLKRLSGICDRVKEGKPSFCWQQNIIYDVLEE